MNSKFILLAIAASLSVYTYSHNRLDQEPSQSPHSTPDSYTSFKEDLRWGCTAGYTMINTFINSNEGKEIIQEAKKRCEQVEKFIAQYPMPVTIATIVLASRHPKKMRAVALMMTPYAVWQYYTAQANTPSTSNNASATHVPESSSTSTGTTLGS